VHVKHLAQEELLDTLFRRMKSYHDLQVESAALRGGRTMRKQLLLLIAVSCVFAVTMIVLLSLFMSGAANRFPDNSANQISPVQMIRERTEAVLQEAKYPMQTKSSSTVPSKSAVCGSWLPAILQRNNNQYSITIVGVWGDDASPIPGGTGSTTALVHVDFPDGSRIEMQYYAYSLDTCRLIQSNSELF
jgi:hypothetical protein